MTAIGLGFIGLTVVCYWALALILRKTEASLRPVSVGIASWLLFSAVLAYFGFFENFERFPPRIGMFSFLELIAILFLVYFSKFSDALTKISNESLYALQSFRIPLEILMVYLAAEKLLPRQMTWLGWNFDVAIGITALGMSYLAYKQRLTRKLELIWNVVGLISAISIAMTGLFSAPTIIQLIPAEPPTFVIGYFPFQFLPHFLLPLAITLHLIVLRRLRLKESPV